MSSDTGAGYQEEIRRQKEAWQRKPVLRLLYHHWYAQIVAALSPHRPVVEIGAGCGNFKEYFPECLATDVFASGPWIDRVVDAQALDFAPDSVGNFVVFDCIHHLQRPLHFLRQMAVALRPGGRAVFCEPASTPWSRFVYGALHHEPFDPSWDLFGLDSRPPELDPKHTFANDAIPELLFWTHRAKTLAAVPAFRIHAARKFGFLLYPMTGGFSYRCFAPRLGFRTALRVEDALLRPFASWLTGMRMLVVLERQ